MKSMRFAAVGVVLGFITGCATVESGQKFDTSAEARLEVGQTTVTDAEAWFGKPTQVTQNSDGSKVLVYVHVVAHGNFVGHGSAETETLGLSFGPDGKLRRFTTGGTPTRNR
jgi:hypothetical protein